MPTAPDPGEPELATLAIGSAQVRLDGLTGDLRDGDAASPSLTLQAGGHVIGEADRCAAHTCILAYLLRGKTDQAVDGSAQPPRKSPGVSGARSLP